MYHNKEASHTVFFNDQPRPTMDRSENYPFFQQNKNMTNKHHKRINHIIQKMKITIAKINNKSAQINKTIFEY